LNEGGVFVLSEKIQSSDTMIDYYHGYKKVNGYSDMEIAQKRQALEDSLKPDTLVSWQLRLEEAGFKHAEVWFKAFNFVSVVAIK
jgi:tRNA (cmo5U34)-methyltransferase